MYGVRIENRLSGEEAGEGLHQADAVAKKETGLGIEILPVLRRQGKAL